jgi:hypothetical protein
MDDPENHIKYNWKQIVLNVVQMILIHALLAIMLVSYAIPIGIVWYQCARATSVSQIICKNKTGIIAAMAVMAIATCAYEHQRVKCASIEHAHLHKIGFACIVSLLICIFSLVSIDESHATHYVFAVLGFGAIIAFTLVHSALMQTPVCAAVIATQFAACAHITHRFTTDGDIFLGEVAFIGAFALFYLYLHWIGFKEWRTAPQFAPP